MTPTTDAADVPILFLDIDGTVRHGLDELGRFVNHPADVVVFPEAVDQMRAWKDAGGRIVGVSNQGGIALGHVDLVPACAAMAATNIGCANLFDKILLCPHHPAATSPKQARCWCRKPLPGLPIEAVIDLGRLHPDESYPPHLALFVGDRPEDQQCAAALNVDFKWAADWRNGR